MGEGGERGGLTDVSCHLQIPRCYRILHWASREGRTGTQSYQKSDQTRTRIRVLCQEEVISLQSSYHTIELISHTSTVMLKILQARPKQYMNHDFPDVQAGFRKGRGTRDQIANICRIKEKAREFQKNIYFCLLIMPKPFTVWITANCGKF